MTAAGLPSGGSSPSTLSIGSVLDALRDDFPEITISKIRFLESEGLIHPSRTPAGYRQFSHGDVARLRFVLSAQRDHYLPLKVIRAKLEEMDADPASGSLATADPAPPAGPDLADPVPGRARSLTSVADTGAGHGEHGGHGGPGGGGPGGPGGPGPFDLDAGTGAGSVDRSTLLAEDGVDASLLDSLEHHGVLRPDAGGTYEADAPAIVRTAAALARLGVEPRLLRGARGGADREVGLLAQLVAPVAHGRAPEAGRRADELSRELAALSGRLHTLLVGAGLRRELRR